MYLKQCDLKISGSMADFTKRVVSHARGNASRAVLEDEEFNNSCEDDTISESESSDSDGENSYVEESFEVMRGGSRGGGGLTLILSVGEGRFKVIST